MLFDSVNFVLFLGAVWLVYQFIPQRWRWLLLLSASFVFYAFLGAPLLIAALVLVIIVAHVVGRKIASENVERRRSVWLWLGIAANGVILCSIKYALAAAKLLGLSSVALVAGAGLIVTMGISYFTLQAIGYLVDVYWGEIAPEGHFGRLALYLSFFPKLLQGPIERGSDLLPQLKAPYQGSRENMRSGVILFAWGLFKKAVVANRLAPYVAAVYGDVHSYTGVSLIMATYVYSLQIYADFSGYTDMALGAALLFDIKLTQNFKSPYFATSVADFWRRWHISFSKWILHYIFEPLQMSWRGWRLYGSVAALLITFGFSGLWHGVSWGFLIWGLLHGIYLSVFLLWRAWKPKVPARLRLQRHPGLQRCLQVCITFNLVTFAWIFFRANNIGDAGYIVTHLFSGTVKYARLLLTNLPHLRDRERMLQPILAGTGKETFTLMLFSAAILLVPMAFKRRFPLDRQPLWLKFGVYYMLFFAIALLSVYDDKGFVYFQF